VGLFSCEKHLPDFLNVINFPDLLNAEIVGFPSSIPYIFSLLAEKQKEL